MKHPLLLLLGILVLAGCQLEPLPEDTSLPPEVAAELSRTPIALVTLPPTFTATVTSTPTTTTTPTSTPTATATLLPTSTPHPWADLSIESLAAREYGGGELLGLNVLNYYDTFTRQLISYPSDGLTIYGFADIPTGEGPFPVVLVLHGYINPSVYNTVTYTARYADDLARAGYLTIHPNYRNYPPSDDGENLFRVGYAVDVLNLIALVRAQAGQPGALAMADPEAIGLWGHSMGGGITLRVITVGAEGVQAAVLYGAMSGDERQNFEHIYNVLAGRERSFEELEVPLEVLPDISPIYHLERIGVPVGIHHGEADTVVPPEWSADLCARLQELNKPAECVMYPGQPHTFTGEGDDAFIAAMIAFFDQYLRGRP